MQDENHINDVLWMKLISSLQESFPFETILPSIVHYQYILPIF